MKWVSLNYSPSSYSIAPDNMPYLRKISNSLSYLYIGKLMLQVLSESVSVKCFQWVPIAYKRPKKKCHI